MPSLKKIKLPSDKVIGVFALEVKRNLARDASEIVEEMRMCGNPAIMIHVQLYCTSARCKYSSVERLVPGAAYLVPGTRFMQPPHRPKNERYEGLFRP